LAVVGDFDANEITKLTGKLLGDWAMRKHIPLAKMTVINAGDWSK